MQTSQNQNGFVSRLHSFRLALASLLLPGMLSAQTLVPTGSTWKYLADGSDQGTIWSQPGFDDAIWPSGPAPLGFGDTNIVTVIPGQFGVITFYFRHMFTVADPSAISGLVVRLLRDDGGIVYLNGVEVFRSNMPNGPISFNTFSLTAVGGPDETNYFVGNIPAGLLVNGANLLAVEIHQVAITSSDVGFDLMLVGGEGPNNQPPVANSQSVVVTQNGSVGITLTGSDPDGNSLTFSIVTSPGHGTLTGTPPVVTYTPNLNFVGSDAFTFKANDGALDSAEATVSIVVQAGPVSLVVTGSVWKYLDTGIDQGDAWVSPFFDDSAWASGPAELGFGDMDEATVLNRTPGGNPLITAYFRQTFEVSDTSAIPGLLLRLWRDDGAAIYVNGVEAFRNNMPAGPVNYATLAFLANDDGNVPVTGRINRSLLVNGANVIAAEVHQNAPSSSDLTFDLELLVAINSAPTANNQAVTVSQDVPTSITLTGTDPDGDSLTFAVVNGPSHGTLSGTAPNLTYTSAQDYQGPDSFLFKVNDGTVDSAVATVSIDVVVPPDPPEVLSAVADCHGSEVVVLFSEPLDPPSATDVFNYFIQDPIGVFHVVIAATLEADQQTVTLVLDPPLNPAFSYLLSVTAICDLVGDCLAFQTVSLAFETVAPEVVCSVATSVLFPANNALVNVGLSAASTEANLQVQVFSDEPEVGQLQDATLSNGILQLRARRNPGSDGRVYLIVVTSSDPCGNLGVCCTTVVIPSNGTATALAAVNAQAAAAQAQCSPTGSPSTPNQILP